MAASSAGQGIHAKNKEDMEDTEDHLATGHDGNISENEAAPENSKNFEDIILLDID